MARSTSHRDIVLDHLGVVPDDSSYGPENIPPMIEDMLSDSTAFEQFSNREYDETATGNYLMDMLGWYHGVPE